MAPNRKKMDAFDLHRLIIRHNIPFRFNSKHPNKTITAQRILASIKNNEELARLAKVFYEGKNYN